MTFTNINQFELAQPIVSQLFEKMHLILFYSIYNISIQFNNLLLIYSLTYF